MNKAYIFISAFFLTLSTTLKAQTDFSLSGLGRVVVSHDKLNGNIIKGDTVTPNEGVGGYFLFDLKPTLKVNKNLHANAILRVKNQFGAFFGEGVTFEFRQFQVMGLINDNIRYEVGDINIQMTPYTFQAFPEMYHAYEAEIFSQRRNIPNYENFVIGNAWRLQGVQGFGVADDFEKGIESISVNAFGVRTNPTNEVSIPDRILAGTRVVVKQSEAFSIGGNYVGLLDIPISSAQVNYTNNVVTGDAKIQLNQKDSPFALLLDGEGGFSSYDFTNTCNCPGGKTVAYKDFFYHFNLGAVIKPAKVKLFAGFRDVGPQFSSPSAQTRRINVTTTPLLFPTVLNQANAPSGIPREQVLFDRFTQENIYNRGINPVLYPFLPQYNNINPYGDATPNRRGISAGAVTDTSLKVLTAEVRVDLLKEIIGEGVADLRSFTGIRGGFLLDISRMAKLKRKVSVNAGYRKEMTTRDGAAPIDLNTSMIDAGFAVEVVKKIDILAGIKMLTSKGNEYFTVRDQYNQLASFTPLDLDIKQNVYSVGARIRFASSSYFTVNYNISSNKYNKNDNLSYNINQLFFHYTIIIP